MDLQAYYGKIKQQEQGITDEFPIIVSNETSDGGKAGLFTEVTRKIAAKFVVQGLARIATGQESQIFKDMQAQAKQAADDLLQTAKMEIALLAMRGVEKLQAGVKPKDTVE